MTAAGRSLVGVIGSGLIGRDPFDRRTWSTISYFLFTQLANQGALHRAVGVEVPPIHRALRMALAWHPRRDTWRQRHYMDPAYRRALTEQVRRLLRPDDYHHDFLQIGAMYDVPSLLPSEGEDRGTHCGKAAGANRRQSAA